MLPAWVQVLSALATPAIALGAGAIAFGQWRTARTKLVLDLFEKRVAVYSAVNEAIRLVIGPGHPETNEPFNLLHRARDSSEYLFGPEVSAFIKAVIIDLANVRMAHHYIAAGQAADVQAGTGKSWATVSAESLVAFSNAGVEMQKLLIPYLKLEHTVPGRRRKRWFKRKKISLPTG